MVRAVVDGTAPDGLAGVVNEGVVGVDDLVSVKVEGGGGIAPAALADRDGDGCLDADDDVDADGRSSTSSTMSSSFGLSSVNPDTAKMVVKIKQPNRRRQGYIYPPKSLTWSSILNAIQLKLRQLLATLTVARRYEPNVMSTTGDRTRGIRVVV